jgi:hypothetical protein
LFGGLLVDGFADSILMLPTCAFAVAFFFAGVFVPSLRVAFLVFDAILDSLRLLQGRCRQRPYGFLSPVLTASQVLPFFFHCFSAPFGAVFFFFINYSDTYLFYAGYFLFLSFANSSA